MANVVKCGNCDLLLDEPSDTLVERRVACLRCGSTARTFEVTGTATVGVQASLAWQRYREFSRRHPGWTSLNLSIIVATSVVGFFLADILGVVVAIVVGVVVYFLVPSGVEKVREIERGGGQHPLVRLYGLALYTVHGIIDWYPTREHESRQILVGGRFDWRNAE